jgi:phosphoglycolate phosphatase
LTYKLVIFDFDGTIADTFPWVLDKLEYIAAKYNLKHPDAHEIELLRTFSVPQAVKRLNIPTWKIPLISRDVQKLMHTQIDNINLFNGIPEMFQKLHRQGIVVGIASSNSKENIERVIGEEIANIIDYFDCGISLNGKDKRLKSILRKSGIPVENSLYVGDEIRDIESTKKIDMPFGAVSWGYAKVEALKALCPHEVFNSDQDMTKKLLGDRTS